MHFSSLGLHDHVACAALELCVWVQWDAALTAILINSGWLYPCGRCRMMPAPILGLAGRMDGC
jgi:hypothetical protein